MRQTNLRWSLALSEQAGYRGRMALRAFCTSCQRTVYIEDEDTPVCPVCSNTLLEVAAVNGEDEEERRSTS